MSQQEIEEKLEELREEESDRGELQPRITTGRAEIGPRPYTPDERCGDLTIGVKGFSIDVEPCLGHCEGFVEITALGQDVRVELDDCERISAYRQIDAGVAFLNIELVVEPEWRGGTGEVSGKLCYWQIGGWQCEEFHEEFSV